MPLRKKLLGIVEKIKKGQNTVFRYAPYINNNQENYTKNFANTSGNINNSKNNLLINHKNI
jgi:hypothetical protein